MAPHLSTCPSDERTAAMTHALLAPNFAALFVLGHCNQTAIRARTNALLNAVAVSRRPAAQPEQESDREDRELVALLRA